MSIVTRIQQFLEDVPPVPKIEGIGYVYSIPNAKDPATDENMIRYTQKLWLDRKAKKGIHFSMKCIFGEFSCLESIELILNNENYRNICDSIEVVFGDTIFNNTNKSKLKKYLDVHSDFLKLYRSTTRPEHHGIMIGDNLMCEDDHKFGEIYKSVMVIENASIEMKNQFLNSFNDFKGKGSLIDRSESLESVPVYYNT